jgi:hypothetical protein
MAGCSLQLSIPFDSSRRSDSLPELGPIIVRVGLGSGILARRLMGTRRMT